MEKKYYLGHIVAILSCLAIIGSAFLSFTMTSSAKQLSQGSSLFDEVLNFSSLELGEKIAVILYLATILFAVVLIVYSIVALVFARKGKPFRANLTVQRILGCLTFLLAIVSFVFLGLYLSKVTAEVYNFNGIGPFVLILASLILIEGEFGVRKPLKRAQTNEK